MKDDYANSHYFTYTWRMNFLSLGVKGSNRIELRYDIRNRLKIRMLKVEIFDFISTKSEKNRFGVMIRFPTAMGYLALYTALRSS